MHFLNSLQLQQNIKIPKTKYENTEEKNTAILKVNNLGTWRSRVHFLDSLRVNQPEQWVNEAGMVELIPLKVFSSDSPLSV